MLIRAVGIVKQSRPTVRCLIIGNGPERQSLEQLAKEQKLDRNIRFLDFIEDHREVYGLMKSSRMFVLPSIREGFSLTVVEANAAGLPVITSNHPDNAARDLIDEGVNGYLAAPNDHEIADRILQVLKHRRTDMKPKDKIDQYDWEKVALTIEKVLTA